MIGRYLNRCVNGISVAALAGCFALILPACARNQADAKRIPQGVMNALTTRFPNAVISEWDRELEDNIVIYDIEFEQEGQKLEADITEDGTIYNWEREIADDDLPNIVRDAVEMQFPGAALGEVMLVTVVEDGMDRLEGYEIDLETADGEAIEIMVTPAGVILEQDSADED